MNSSILPRPFYCLVLCFSWLACSTHLHYHSITPCSGQECVSYNPHVDANRAWDRNKMGTCLSKLHTKAALVINNSVGYCFSLGSRITFLKKIYIYWYVITSWLILGDMKSKLEFNSNWQRVQLLFLYQYSTCKYISIANKLVSGLDAALLMHQGFLCLVLTFLFIPHGLAFSLVQRNFRL